MQTDVLIAGGGIGGLAAAIACARAGWRPRLFEQAAAFGEVGAGLQLGPNAVRRLDAWGLRGALEAVASQPRALCARRADDGAPLARLSLADFPRRHGAPYCTVHRADLHALLLRAAEAAGVPLRRATRIEQVREQPGAVQVMAGTDPCEGDALVAADGVWSLLRAHVAAAAPPRFTGDVAFRALAAQSTLPPVLRSDEVTAWLGPSLHAVSYPVRAGDALNVVLVASGPGTLEPGWDHEARAGELAPLLQRTGGVLRTLLEAMPAWRRWPLYGTPPLPGPQAMAQGRVALLGDAAHPMLPYLAQGAGMAIEDAEELARMLAMARDADVDVPLALRRYALHRWQRCARVQARAQRNGRIFHAQGPLRWGRDAALALAGGRLMDLPWLYGG